MNTGGEVMQTVVLRGGRTVERKAPVRAVRRERERGLGVLVVIPLVAMLGALLALAGLSAITTGVPQAPAASTVEQEEIEVPSVWEPGDAGDYPLLLGSVYTR